jgi:ATP-dependent Lon protease
MERKLAGWRPWKKERTGLHQMWQMRAGVSAAHSDPEGAVKKDGPSAGVTLTTAIASLVTGKGVSPEIAMTGEISLRGSVTPIGGLSENLWQLSVQE